MIARLVDLFGIILSVCLLAGILAMQGLGALAFYGLYWVLRPWE